MDPDKVTKLNGIGVIFRFVTPVISFAAALLSSLVLLYFTGLKTDLLQAKIEAKSNFDKLEAVAQVNFQNIDSQFENHLSHHQAFDKEICERLTVVETLLRRTK